MYYNDDFRSSDQYRYTNRDQLPRDDYAPDPDRTPAHQPVPPKKQGFFHRAALKVTALVLACAVAGGLAGWGGASIANSSGRAEKATIQQSSRQPVSVQVKTVDGQTKMEPAEVYASVVNSAVSINCSATSTNIFGQTTQTASSGSGFIITEDGYVVTNYHVISGASSVQVTLYDGDTYDATVIGGDSDYDVAVLKIEATGLQPVTLGESADVNVGDAVLAIGNPLGTLSGTVTDGIVSALERQVTIDGNNMTLLQTSAAVNPGNSGGGLFNASGELIGIVNAKSTSDSSGNAVDNIGFAIPINSVKAIIEDLISHGYVTGQIVLGVSLVDITDERTARYYGLDSTGVYIQSVESGSIADKGGLQAGDRLLSFGGVEVSTADELKAALAAHSVGDRVEIKVSRNGREYTHSVVLTEYVPSSATN